MYYDMLIKILGTIHEYIHYGIKRLYTLATLIMRIVERHEFDTF